jgi:hypothetical protein
MSDVETKTSKIERGQFKKYAKKYGKDGHNGDPIAVALAGISIEQLPDVAVKNGLDFSKWAHLNKGMQRMNLGNKLRGMHNQGKAVTIGNEEIPGATPAPVEAPEAAA